MNTGKPDIERVIAFQRLLNDFAKIERVIHLKRHDRIDRETDTEHSYNLAMMAWFLAEYFPDVDSNKTVLLALAHDLVEIHAGDTFIFADQSELDTKVARESAAREQLIADWRDFPDVHEAILAYEKRETAEARFVYALDKLMPMLTIYLNDGITWREKQMSLEGLNSEKQQKMAVYPELLEYWSALYDILKRSPQAFPGDMLQ